MVLCQQSACVVFEIESRCFSEMILNILYTVGNPLEYNKLKQLTVRYSTSTFKLIYFGFIIGEYVKYHL